MDMNISLVDTIKEQTEGELTKYKYIHLYPISH
jgi:hypothetical protein